jgi:cytochrome c oxidase subunit 2
MQGLSNFSQGVDTAFYVIIGISLVFLIGLTTLMIYFVVKYNRKKTSKGTGC